MKNGKKFSSSTNKRFMATGIELKYKRDNQMKIKGLATSRSQAMLDTVNP